MPTSQPSVHCVATPARYRRARSSAGGTAFGNVGRTVDGQIPADCTLARPSLMVTSLACIGRPPTQRWRIQITCYDSGGWGYVRAYGQIVTGNGTSVAECDYVDYDYGYPYFSVQP